MDVKKNYLNGQWVGGGETIDVVNPATARPIGINDGVPTTSNAPFGGMKHGGWGRELGIEGLEAFLEMKHVSIGVIE